MKINESQDGKNNLQRVAVITGGFVCECVCESLQDGDDVLLLWVACFAENLQFISSER